MEFEPKPLTQTPEPVTPESNPVEETQELTPEVIKQLVEKASPTEWKYLLKLESYSRQGPAFTRYQKFEVIYGEADIIELRRWDAGYPYDAGEDYLILPKTVPVIVRVDRFDETTSPVIDETELYIFTAEGWKSVIVK